MKTNNLTIALRSVFENKKNENPEVIKSEMTERYILETAAVAKAEDKKTKISDAKITRVVNQCYDRFVKEDEVVQYLKNKHTIQDTMFSFGISAPAVYAIIKTAREFGVIFPTVPKRTYAVRSGISAHRAEVIERIRAGVSNQAIAKEFGVKIGNVSQFRNKLFKEDVARNGFSDIKTGREVMTAEERQAQKAKRAETRAERAATIQEVVEADKEMLEEIRSYCCFAINTGKSFDEIILSAEKKGRAYAAIVTNSYLESLKYGSSLNTVLDNIDDPEFEYKFENGNLVYEYFDGGYMKAPKVYSRNAPKEIAQMFFDPDKKFRKIIDESTLAVINAFVKSGVVEDKGINTTLRIIGMPEEQQEALYKVAFE